MNKRFVALDSLRGVAACFIVIFHFHPYSHFADALLIRNAYLFVDFFFALSGFIILQTYGARLQAGFGIARFMALRFGRLVPLHLFMLALFFIYECAWAVFLGSFSDDPRPAFEGPTSIESLAANVALLNAVGLFEDLTWNTPSWSIGAEFYTYLVFGLIIVLFKSRAPLGCLIAGMCGFLAMMWIRTDTTALMDDGFTMDGFTGDGMVRCIYGFSLGALLSFTYERMHSFFGSAVITFSIIEIATVAVCLGFVIGAGDNAYSFAAPVVFAGAVYVFAQEKGVVSALLSWPWFAWLGTLSYSIYMVHIFVILLLTNAISAAEKLFRIPLFTVMAVEGVDTEAIGRSLYQGDLAYLLLLASVIFFSSLTYRFVEAPARQYSRKLIAKMPGGSSKPDLR